MSPAASPVSSTHWSTRYRRYAGSFLCPRNFCGARYGASVSRSILSIGARLATLRRASAFLNVRLAVNGKAEVNFYGRMGGGIPSETEILQQIEALI